MKKYYYNKIQNISRECFENLYTKKTRKFGKIYKSSKIIWTAKIKVRRQIIASNEIKDLLKSSPSKKSPNLEGFAAKFCKSFRGRLNTKTLLNLSHKIELEGILPNSFYEAGNILVAHHIKNTTNKEN